MLRWAVLLWAVAALADGARAAETAALYEAYWAGLPAGEIRLVLRDEPFAYRGEIAIRSAGLPRLVTRFRGSAASEGRLVASRLPEPLNYVARYDLRKKRDKRLSMQFQPRDGFLVAERGPEDTSEKPPLAEPFRRNVLDPLSALAAIRDALRQGGREAFAVPVYDGARRFDVNVRVLAKRDATPVLHLELTLKPLAGFKGESSSDGDPDTAPRPVDLTISDDARLLPLAMSVSLYYLPLVVRLHRVCPNPGLCGW